MPADFDMRRIEVIDDATAALYRRMSPAARVRLGLGSHEFAIRTMEAGIRSRHPDWNDQRIREEVLRRLTRAAG
jgi:hypothetical protein